MLPVLIQPPAEEPVTLQEFKVHVRIDNDAQDDDLQTKLLAARIYIENDIGRPLITSTWEVSYPAWPSCWQWFDLDGNTQSVVSIKYTDSDLVVHTIDPADYRAYRLYDPDANADSDAGLGRVIPASGKTWPSGTLDVGEPIAIRYVAGWKNKDSVPATIKAAIHLLASHWYRNREAVTVGVRAASGQGKEAAPMISTPLAMAVSALTAPYAIWKF